MNAIHVGYQKFKGKWQAKCEEDARVIVGAIRL